MERKTLRQATALREKGKWVSGKSGQAKKQWQKPTLKDVSAEIMAQPYIRFT